MRADHTGIVRALELLAADCTYEQIGARLVVSIGTVRTHVRHIYEKLGAHRREQAIARGAAVGVAGRVRRNRRYIPK